MSISMAVVLLVFVAGFLAGLCVAFVVRGSQAKTARNLADEIYRQSEEERRANVNAVIDHVKASFGNMSLEALTRSTEEFLKLAKQKLDSEREVGVKELEAKKGLIDQQLQKMTSQLENVSKLMQDLEKDRVEKFGELAKHLQLTGEQTHSLLQTTNSLREALAGTKSRGQWGERMAEDILRLSGFMEDVNYLKQKTIEGAGSRPDFTFLLPRGMKMNMDVKFPLDNYMKYLEAGTEGEKAKCRGDFLRDVKARIKEITTRDYINPDQNTVNYVLLFIPNEQVYGFIHEQDSLILDEGMKSRVILCSPVTLFAVLAVIRQALDCFALEQTSNEILSLLGAFNKQWDLFVKKFEALGKRIEDVHKEYEGLNTTRRRQLEKPLTKIEELRKGRGIEQALSDGEIDGPEG